MAYVSAIAVKKKKYCLTLKIKIEVINYVKKNPSTNVRHFSRDTPT